jgi:hypothetical protein
MKLQLLLGVAVLGSFTGCVAYVDRPPRGEVYIAPTGGELTMMEDDYVYYPTYEVYYSSRRHNYIYLDGRSWVTRSAPPRVSVDVFMASPSVNMGFHNAPSFHHQAMVRQYPKNWAPPGREQDHKDKPRDDWRKNDRSNRDR